MLTNPSRRDIIQGVTDISNPFVKADECDWIDWNVGGYPVRVPKFLSDYHGAHSRQNWESCRYRSMEQRLKPTDILFDIGTEQAYCTVPIAKIIGSAKNICLFEPSALAWPNIFHTWNENGLDSPLECWAGFVSNETRVEQADYVGGMRGHWPECAFTGKLLNTTAYRYDSPNEQRSSTHSITIDDFVAQTKIVPTVLNIDVEGYELRVLQGAIGTLASYRPLVWLSEHLYEYAGGPGNNMLQRFEGGDPLEEQRKLIQDLGYERIELGTDHECHCMLIPKE